MSRPGDPTLERHGDVWVSHQRLDVLHAETSEWLAEMVLVAIDAPEDANDIVRIEVGAKSRKGTQRFEHRVELSDPIGWGDLVRKPDEPAQT